MIKKIASNLEGLKIKVESRKRPLHRNRITMVEYKLNSYCVNNLPTISLSTEHKAFVKSIKKYPTPIKNSKHLSLIRKATPKASNISFMLLNSLGTVTRSIISANLPSRPRSNKHFVGRLFNSKAIKGTITNSSYRLCINKCNTIRRSSLMNANNTSRCRCTVRMRRTKALTNTINEFPLNNKPPLRKVIFNSSRYQSNDSVECMSKRKNVLIQTEEVNDVLRDIDGKENIKEGFEEIDHEILFDTKYN